MLFPLPLTPFEFYYWSDDRPEYPTAFPLELSFSGRLDRAAFEAAVIAAQRRHPLLAALVDESGPRPQWVSAGEQTPPFHWAAQGVPATHPDGDYIDLRRHVGLRVWVRESEATSRVRFEFHHACCDGVAAFQFIEEVLLNYANAFGQGEPLALNPLVPERLAERGALAVENPEKPTLAIAARDAWVTARVWGDILFRRTAVLAVPDGRAVNAPAASGGPVTEVLEFETRWLNADEIEKLRAVAAAHGTTVNDLMIRDMLLVLRDWDHAHAKSSRGRLCVSVPVNVRLRTERDMPVANRIGFGFVSPAKRDFADESTLLAAVHRQMTEIKEWKLGLYFLGGLAAASSVKGVIPWALNRNRSFATTVLSNVGRVLAKTPLPRRDGKLLCGNVVLERISAVPPIRPLTRAAIAVFEYAGETAVCVRCDPRLFSAADRQAFTDAYVDRVRQTARQHDLK